MYFSSQKQSASSWLNFIVLFKYTSQVFANLLLIPYGVNTFAIHSTGLFWQVSKETYKRDLGKMSANLLLILYEVNTFAIHFTGLFWNIVSASTHCFCVNTLQCTATNCNTVHHTSKHYNMTAYTKFLIKIHCAFRIHMFVCVNTLQHIETHCSTLQHTIIQHRQSSSLNCGALFKYHAGWVMQLGCLSKMA